MEVHSSDRCSPSMTDQDQHIHDEKESNIDPELESQPMELKVPPDGVEDITSRPDEVEPSGAPSPVQSIASPPDKVNHIIHLQNQNHSEMVHENESSQEYHRDIHENGHHAQNELEYFQNKSSVEVAENVPQHRHSSSSNNNNSSVYDFSPQDARGDIPLINVPMEDNRLNEASHDREKDVINHNSPIKSEPHSDTSEIINVHGGSNNDNSPYNGSYEDSLSEDVPEFVGSETCYENILVRRGRGRPRGSKNGTGMGRCKQLKEFHKLNDDRSCTNYDLRNIPDPFAGQRRGRPRSRFIVDLGEQNHEAWTKAKEDLNISDGELTTLLLSL